MKSHRNALPIRYLALLLAVTGAAIAAGGAQAQTGVAESPVPVRPASETAYLRKLEAALKPLRDYAPDPEVATQVKEAVAAVRGNNPARANDIKSALRDPVAIKFIEWVRLRSGYGYPQEYSDFLANNPLWPERSLMVQRFEEALFTQGGSAASIKSYLTSSPPQTGIGHAALASAYLAEGNNEQARKLASNVWRDMTIPATLETGFLRRFSSLLTEADHKWRFDRLISDDVRWAGNRTERAAVAKRVVPLLSGEEQKKATARLAVFNKAKNARALLEGLDHDHTDDTGLAFHRAQVLRRSDRQSEAAKLVLSIPPDPAKIANLDEWWAERRQLAYAALKARNPKLAYELTRDAGPLSVNPRKEQTFMAGWIALRYLKRPDDAERHFKDFSAAADGPLSRAKSAYWLGRTAEVKGDKAAATAHYKTATRNPDTFHGLLSMQKLEPGRSKLELTPPAFPTAEQVQRFNTLDAVKAMLLAHKAGLSREYSRGFLTSLRIGLPTEAEAGMIAYLAEMMGDTQMSVRVAKSAIARGDNLITFGYPVHPFPSYKPLRTPPETAFLLGIARQETEFETQTVSGAGAKGLLQVMTITAKHVCRDYKIKCDISRLLADKAYNTTIASAYIGDRMEEFGGSYVLGLAGYNAGPGRARQWIRENGDPRDADVDPVDWIERIPFTETREYVTKVMSNIQIYRARLGGEANALRIEDDLHRARGSHKQPTTSDLDEQARPAQRNDDG